MLEDFIKNQNYLIDLEHQEEVNQLTNKITSLSAKLCQHDGLSILHLEIESMHTALFGRCCLSLHKLDSSPISQSFKVGDEICLYNPKHKSSITSKTTDNNAKDKDKHMVNGLISKITMYKIQIIIDGQMQYSELQLYEPPLRMDLRSSQKTHISMKNAMQQLLTKDAIHHPLVQLLFYPDENTHQHSLLKPRIKEGSILYSSLLLLSNKDVNHKHNDVINNIDIPIDIDIIPINNVINAKSNLNHDFFWNEGLNISQRKAIFCALSTPSVAIIHGPPGTGKTSTLTELILQAIYRNMKVLVCAPSNIAVDTILSRLSDYKNKFKTNSNKNKQQTLPIINLQMIRIGHPARISQKIMQYSLDAMISNDEGTEIVFDVRKDIDTLRNEMSKKRYDRKDKNGFSNCNTNSSTGCNTTSSSGGPGIVPSLTRNQQRVELKQLCKEAKDREKAIVKRIINQSNVVLCTCVGANSKLLDELSFDMVIIDEAAQGLEAACWIPILKGNRVILAGDHCQLPPTIKSIEADKGGLSVTLFERIIKDNRFKEVVCLLDTQYRMNSLISDWASDNMYHGTINSHSSVANHTLNDIVTNRNNSNRVVVKGLKNNVNDDNTMIEEEDGFEEEGVDNNLVREITIPHIGISVKEDNSSCVDTTTEEVVLSFPVLLLVDTSSCGMLEDTSTSQEGGSSNHSSSRSHRNFHEADLVQKHVYALVQAGVKPSQIGVITPYNAQLDVLRELLLPTNNNNNNNNNSINEKSNESNGKISNTKDNKNKLKVIPKSVSIGLNPVSSSDAAISLEGLEIKTIDGFQGGEKECILLSLVRSNTTHTVGFLGEKRRINVAVTRAKRHLAIFCDSDTCRIDPFIRNLLDHISENGDHVSADEYVDYMNTGGSNHDNHDSIIKNKKERSNTNYSNGFKTLNQVVKLFQGSNSNQERIVLAKKDFIVLLEKFKRNELLGLNKINNNEDYIYINNKNNPHMNTKESTIFIHIIASTQASLVHLDKDRSIIPPYREFLDVKYIVSEDILRFPISVNSYQRMLIHECAEELHLFHRSSDTKSSKERFIEVSLKEFLDRQQILALTSSSYPQQQQHHQEQSIISEIPVATNQDLPISMNQDLPISMNQDLPISTNQVEMISNIHVMDDILVVNEENLNSLSIDTSSLPATNNNNQNNSNESTKEQANPKKNNTIAKKITKNTSSGKIYVSAARASYQELMEKQLMKKLNSTDNNKDDEDALIEAAILHNQDLARYNQYKIGSTPMPNPEKIKSKELVRSRLAEAAESRQKKQQQVGVDTIKGQIPSSNINASNSIGNIGSIGGTNIHGFLSTSSSSNNNSNCKDTNKKKKVVKKPPPNFGGGKLGTS